MPSMLHFLAHALFTICCLVQVGSGRLPEFYHSTSAISAELENLEETCPGLFVEREPIDSQHFIDVVSLSRSENPVSHFFLLAGEHARELITAESALHFLKVLCGEEPALRKKAEAALADTSFTVIVNGNPISRAKVENGDFCVS
ncbi:hypothetical protein, conserved [Eimeria tenella]|uniref:Peptidase M14 carboxypeptidase A domain-containing protein n=1 Tax=Eimeria tenella TaxID=5802 RepID=U6KLI2_EIMTE|nr:hypothetical protein, conserved [Eimeria tenella]CDJ37681.1 hypothetical protein, conserved [Eimeria tenella]|eukprot:XP_013228519.1 hypothetical protein, conserved [Eimeria tenella]